MLVQIQTVHLAFRRNAQQPHGVDGQHHHHGDRERRHGDERATDQLGLQDSHAAAVEQTGQRCGVIRSNRTRRAILARGKQAQRYRPPDSADPVNRNRSDGIVNSQIFHHFDSDDHDHTGDSA